MKKFLIIAEGIYGEPFHRFVYGNSKEEIKKLAEELYGNRFIYVDEICDDLFYTQEELKEENKRVM